MKTIKSLIGVGVRPVVLDDEPPASGTAREAVATIIADVKRTLEPTVREDSRDHALDAVIRRDDLDECMLLLDGIIGKPKKPFDQPPEFDEELERMVESERGIGTRQCLYLRRHSDGRVMYAALWPWRSGLEVTLRVGVYGTEVTPEYDGVLRAYE